MFISAVAGYASYASPYFISGSIFLSSVMKGDTHQMHKMAVDLLVLICGSNMPAAHERHDIYNKELQALHRGDAL
jgi:hypothetical protein